MPKFGDYDDMADGSLSGSDSTLVKSGATTKEVPMSVIKTYTSGKLNVNTVGTSGSTETLVATAIDHFNAITVTADCTLTFPTAAAGKSFILALTQDATGGWSIVWPSSVIWVDGVESTLTDGIAVTDMFRFVCADGTNWIGTTVAQRLSAVAPPNPVQYKVGGASGATTVTTTTVVMDATPVQGNLLIAFVHSVGTRTCTPASGTWATQYSLTPTDGTRLECFTHTVGVAETNSYVFNWSDTSEYNSVILIEVANYGAVDEVASLLTGNTASPSGTSTNHPNLVFLHCGTDGGAAAGSIMDFNSAWTTVIRHFPQYHANGVAYYYAYGTTWPSLAIKNVTTTDIPRAIASINQ